MRESSIRKKRLKDKLGAEYLLLLLLGVSCPIFYLARLPEVTFSRFMVMAAGVFTILILWTARFVIRKGWPAAVMILLLIFARVIWRLREKLIDQLWLINDGFFGPLEEPEPVTLLLALGLCLWAILLFLLEGSLAGHILVSLLLLALAAAAPILGWTVSAAAVFMIFAFIVLFLILHRQLRFQANRKTIERKRPERVIHRWILSAAGLLLLCFGIGSLISRQWDEQLYQTVFDAEAYYYDTIDLFRTTAEPGEGAGEISRGNNYINNTEYLHLYTDVKPTEDLYLKDFSGDSYIGSRWSALNEEEVYQQVGESLGWQQWNSMTRGMYVSMYFVRNLQSPTADKMITLAVEPLLKNARTYTPYFSRIHDMFLTEDAPIPADADIFQYYESQDLHTDQGYDQSEFAQWTSWYHMLENTYEEAAKKRFTEVPEEGLDRLKQLVQDNPKKDYEEISTFILYTLQTRASYSLTPGRVPLGQDSSEYFLFESGKGYCEHFASAATLLYRLYGIPARYATGFRISPDAFKEGPSGYWEAVVTDQCSHAWVEIFLTGYGWTPVDVTPTGDGRIHGNYPGYDRATLDEMLKDYVPPVSTRTAPAQIPDMPEIPVDLPQPQTSFAPEGAAPVPEPASSAYLPPYWLMIALAGIISAVLLSIFLEERRAYRQENLDERDPRQLYIQLLTLLHAAGLSRKVSGEEDDLDGQMQHIFPDIDLDRAAGLAEKAEFSGRKLSADEQWQLTQTVTRAAEKARQFAPWWRRAWLQWIKAYC